MSEDDKVKFLKLQRFASFKKNKKRDEDHKAKLMGRRNKFQRMSVESRKMMGKAAESSRDLFNIKEDEGPAHLNEAKGVHFYKE